MQSKKKKPARPPMIVQAFSQRLRDVRASKNLTQFDLATKADVTVTYISRLEAGSSAPGIDLLDRLARALGVEITELLPPPAVPATADLHRQQVRELFEALLPQAGQETLTMLGIFLSRLAESPAAKR
jgi:transcriptional regulator with XRE-family HTH domain